MVVCSDSLSLPPSAPRFGLSIALPTQASNRGVWRDLCCGVKPARTYMLNCKDLSVYVCLSLLELDNRLGDAYPHPPSPQTRIVRLYPSPVGNCLTTHHIRYPSPSLCRSSLSGVKYEILLDAAFTITPPATSTPVCMELSILSSYSGWVDIFLSEFVQYICSCTEFALVLFS